MADAFTGGADYGGTGAGEFANESFKIFGMSVAQFAAAVAAMDVLGMELGNTIENSVGKAVKTQKKSAASTDEFSRATRDFGRDVDKNAQTWQERAREEQRQAKDYGKVAKIFSTDFKTLFKDWKKSQSDAHRNRVLSFKALVKDFKQARGGGGLEGIANRDTAAVLQEDARQRVQTRVVGGLQNITKTVGPLVNVFKSFLMRFIPFVSVLSVLTKVLTALVAGFDAASSLTRTLGIDTSRGFARSDIRTGTNPAFTSAFGNANSVFMSDQAIADQMVAINSGLENANKLTADLVAQSWGVSRAFNMSAEEVGRYFGTLSRALGLSENQITDIFGVAAVGAERLGLNITDITSQILEWPSAAFAFATNTRAGRVELGRMFLQAQLLESSLREARNFGDAMFDQQTMVQTAADFQRAGLGITMTDLITSAYDDPTTIIKRIYEEVDKLYPGGIASMNGANRRFIQQLVFSAGGGSVGQLFNNDVGAFSKGLSAFAGGRLDELETILADMMNPGAGPFSEENIRKRIGTFIKEGQTLDQIVEGLGDKLVDALVKSKLGQEISAGMRALVRWANFATFGFAGRGAEDTTDPNVKAQVDAGVRGFNQSTGTDIGNAMNRTAPTDQPTKPEDQWAPWDSSARSVVWWSMTGQGPDSVPLAPQYTDDDGITVSELVADFISRSGVDPSTDTGEDRIKAAVESLVARMKAEGMFERGDLRITNFQGKELMRAIEEQRSGS